MRGPVVVFFRDVLRDVGARKQAHPLVHASNDVVDLVAVPDVHVTLAGVQTLLASFATPPLLDIAFQHRHGRIGGRTLRDREISAGNRVVVIRRTRVRHRRPAGFRGRALGGRVAPRGGVGGGDLTQRFVGRYWDSLAARQPCAHRRVAHRPPDGIHGHTIQTRLPDRAIVIPGTRQRSAV